MKTKTPSLKKLKVATLAVTSLIGYYSLQQSKTIHNWQQKLDTTNISDGFAFFITINLIKYFLLIFGIITMLFLLVNTLKPNQ
ncbi:hypothetical protein [Tenacibaculum sp. 190524A02b]|uniref:Uncharacterized protein n=1 Tax=Tenacibaculum vairaonense TaxID=3137860 RepID=A0ABM9PJY1_9FLAO